MIKLLKNHRLWARVFLCWSFALILFNIIPNYTPKSLLIEDRGHLRTDYLQHIFVFMVYPVFYFLSGRRTFINRYITVPWLLIFAGIIFSGLAEVLQVFIPGRTFNPVDLFLNVSGFVLGVIVGWTGSKLKWWR